MRFKMTTEGCAEATAYLKEVGQYDRFMDNTTSTDGFSLVAFSNEHYAKNTECKIDTVSENVLFCTCGAHFSVNVDCGMDDWEIRGMLMSQFLTHKSCRKPAKRAVTGGERRSRPTGTNRPERAPRRARTKSQKNPHITQRVYRHRRKTSGSPRLTSRGRPRSRHLERVAPTSIPGRRRSDDHRRDHRRRYKI